MDFLRFRSPAVTLGDFLRSLAVPRTSYGVDAPTREQEEWEVFRARQGGTKRLDYFGGDVVGPDGAVLVLGSMEKSPGVTDIVLSQNSLGDDGMRELLVGMKRLRSRDIGAHLQSINLSNCGLSDVSLHLLTLHLLQPSPHPPSLRSLYLNYNNISLGAQSTLSTLPEFLGTTLTSPSCSLRCLDLTSNSSIGTKGLTALLSSLKLAAGPSYLAELRLSVTGLTPDCAEPLAQWLEDPAGGARLLVLTLNACSLGAAGVRRIARSVVSGQASSLLHLEALANGGGDEDDRWAEVNAALVAQEEDEDWTDEKGPLQEALKRNQQVYRETRLAALRLAGPARILFGGNAQERDGPAEGAEPFPFLRLPIELQVHVLRCLVLLSPSSTAHHYPPPGHSRPVASSSPLSSPLTEPQFLRLLSHCASRPTLLTERRIAAAHAAGEAPSLTTSSGARAWAKPKDEQDVEDGWEEWFLRQTGCDRFERAALL
ncbi:hypothetical protein JCM10450v2_003815 [Rhodotorula kratochvilovae]